MVLRFMRHDEKPKELEINIFGEKNEFQHWRSDENQKELEIKKLDKKRNFSTGGLIIGGVGQSVY